MPIVWRVKLPVQQQIVLGLLFAVGFFITLVGAIRTYYLYNVTSKWDKTWEAYPVWLTSSVELYVGIVSSSGISLGKKSSLLIFVLRFAHPSQQRRNSSVDSVLHGSIPQLHLVLPTPSHDQLKFRIIVCHIHKRRKLVSFPCKNMATIKTLRKSIQCPNWRLLIPN